MKMMKWEHFIKNSMLFEGRAIWNLVWIMIIFGIMLAASFLCYNIPYRGDRYLFSLSILGAFAYLIGAIVFLPLGIIAFIRYNSTATTDIAFEALRKFLHEKAGIDYIDYIENKNETIIKSVWARRRQVLLFISGKAVTRAESNGAEFTNDCVIRVFDKEFETRHIEALNKAIIAAARTRNPNWPWPS